MAIAIFMRLLGLKYCKATPARKPAKNIISMDLILQHDLESKIALKTLKRKISEENARDVIGLIARDYCKKYRTNVNPKDLEWRGYVLYDKRAMQERMFVLSSDCQFVPPRESRNRKVLRFSHENYQYVSSKTPTLYTDALLCVFRYLKPAQLLCLRLVCKEWARNIRACVAFWRLKDPFSFGRHYRDAFEAYVYHMFIGVSPQRIVRFFFHNPGFFFHVATLSIGGGHVVMATKHMLRYGLYVLRDKLYYANEHIDVNVFLNVYRDTIKK